VQCLHRWTKILKPGLTKGPWTIEEDRKLLEWIRMEGPYKWSQCSEFIQGRSGKQCRERWFNTLNPEVKKGGWSAEEDYTIFKFFSQYGSKWSKIAINLPGRTENSIKNRFYSTLRRISAEKKQSANIKTDNDICNNSRINGSNSLDELLKFFPLALEEKTKIYNEQNENGDNCNDIKMDSLEEFGMGDNENKFLNKKTTRSFKVPTSINNTFNFNLNINHGNTGNINSSTISCQSDLSNGKCSPKKLSQTKRNFTDKKKKVNNPLKINMKERNKKSIDELEKVIESFCCEDVKLAESNFERLEDKINLLLGAKSNSHLAPNFNNFNQKQQNNNKNSLPNNVENINNLLSQLNELETLLVNTKKELFNVESSQNKPMQQQSMPQQTSQINISDYLQNISALTMNNFNLNAIHSNNSNQKINNITFSSLQKPIIDNTTYTNNAFPFPEDSNSLFLEHMFKF
jgi:hypothetical protein